MMKITRSEPELLFSLPRLINRLSKGFPVKGKMDLEEKLYRLRAGYSGELKVDRYLESVPYMQGKIILTGVALPIKFGSLFQIDTLIISERYVMIVEVKNVKGDLYFKTNPHYLLRVLDGEETVMDCPITQLELAKIHLVEWFRQQGMNIEVQGVIVLANRNAHIREIPPHAPVIYMKRLSILLGEKEKYPEVLSTVQLERLRIRIRQQQSDYVTGPLCSYFHINPKYLKRGQLCVKCHESTDYKTERLRYCKYCELTQPNNFRETIEDWLMLVDSSITNAQCRYFLDLKNKDDAVYVLRRFGLKSKGHSVNTVYYKPHVKDFSGK